MSERTKVSSELDPDYDFAYKWYMVDGHYYKVVGLTEDGKLQYRSIDDPSNTFEMDAERDFQSIIQEGIENGILVGEGSASRNPQGSVYRCEFILELWRGIGKSEEVELDEETLEEANSIASPETYYVHAVRWLLAQGGDAIHGMYSYRDMEGAITWLEMAYLLYGVLGVKKPQKWSTINPGDFNVSVMTHIVNGKKRMDNRFASYKQKRWMKSYLTDLRRGKRYTPFPAYCSFVNMKQDGILPNTEGKARNDNGNLVVEGGLDIDLENEEWCLLELNRLDFARVLPDIINLVRE